MTVKSFLACGLVGWALVACPALAFERVIEPPERFIAETLGPQAKVKTLWMVPEVQQMARRILGHPPAQLRQRYWTDGTKTVWILEEIGKEELITAGFVVENGAAVAARVLVYRETRGHEIASRGFLAQFEGAKLLPDGRLSKNIDGISGATLSVRAMERMERLALYFDAQSRAQ